MPERGLTRQAGQVAGPRAGDHVAEVARFAARHDGAVLEDEGAFTIADGRGHAFHRHVARGVVGALAHRINYRLGRVDTIGDRVPDLRKGLSRMPGDMRVLSPSYAA
jgi:hypothetical protein